LLLLLLLALLTLLLVLLLMLLMLLLLLLLLLSSLVLFTTICIPFTCILPKEDEKKKQAGVKGAVYLFDPEFLRAATNYPGNLCGDS
jgi:hypothetical protein